MREVIEDVRFLPAVVLGGVVSFALFLLMHQLIATDQRGAESSPPMFRIGTIRFHPEHPVVHTRPHVQPKPKPVPRPHMPVSGGTPNTTVVRLPLQPKLNLVPDGDGPAIRDNHGRSPGLHTGDNPAPVARILVKPLYPPDAEYQGIEGAVQACFTVAADGSVVDPRVSGASSSQARRVFGPYAMRTVLQWKYFPRQVNGVAVATPNVCETIQFVLHDAEGSGS